MKVILLADVKGVGKKNQQIEVSDGYASNYLIPRKLAVKVSEKSVQILAQQQEDARIAYEKAKKDAIELGEKLKTITLEFKLKLGANGRVFGSISFKQVEEQLKNKYKITRQSEKIKIIQADNEQVISDNKKADEYGVLIGEEKRISYAKDGFISRGYLSFYDEKGRFVKQSRIREDKYNPTKGIIIKREN